MKKLFLCSAVVAVYPPAAIGAQQMWTGRISDAMCKSDHAMMQKGTTKMSDSECAIACAKSGQKYVLLSGGKTYRIENQKLAGVQANAGASVKVIGVLSADGNSVRISKLEPVNK